MRLARYTLLVVLLATVAVTQARRPRDRSSEPILDYSEVVVSSGWHYVTSGELTLIPLDGPEVSDPDDLHAPGSPDIQIPATGRYEVSVEAMVGLWAGGPPSWYGYHTLDRELLVQRILANGSKRWIARVQATANVTSQAYLRLGGTWLELSADDRLRFFFRYYTDEEELPVILSRVSMRKIEG